MQFLHETAKLYNSGLPNDARLARLQRENELKELKVAYFFRKQFELNLSRPKYFFCYKF